MKVKPGHKIYFIGIGGIGMSALARWCKENGAYIFGYDLTPTKLTKQLESEGMQIHYTVDVKLIPSDIDCCIYTPAIPFDNEEFVHFRSGNIPLFKRSEFLGEISKDYKTIAIAGTHGKTSITALTAHILKKAGLNISAFIGGIARNYNTNLLLSKETEYLIVEADEFDRSLLKLNPDIGVITSMDIDHMDIYKDLDDITSTFLKFAKGIKDSGALIYNTKTGEFDDVFCKKFTYSAYDEASAIASNIRINSGKYLIDIQIVEMVINDVEISTPGFHNIENTLASCTIAYLLGLKPKIIKTGVESFKGVERRMEYLINSDNLVLIDDYAHHPEEIRNTIETARHLFPDKKLTAIFQPHLYSRTRDLANGFSEELSKADEVYLLDIYPAREKPIEGITSSIIAQNIYNAPCKVVTKDELLELLMINKPQVILTMGAGDIGYFVEDIKESMKELC